MKEQIEEMAKVIHGYCKAKCPDGGCSYCVEYMKAEAIYNAGYHKQGEGEWETIPDKPAEEFTAYLQICSECNYFYKNFRPNGYKYCPNCGAKMKGGAE